VLELGFESQSWAVQTSDRLAARVGREWLSRPTQFRLDLRLASRGARSFVKQDAEPMRFGELHEPRTFARRPSSRCIERCSRGVLESYE
jgi:hypothetical protein